VKTIKDNLLEMLNTIMADTRTLIERYSSIKPINQPVDSVLFISTAGCHSWQELPTEGKQLQTRILSTFRSFSELMRAIIPRLSRASQKTCREAIGTLYRLIEQHDRTWCENTGEAVRKVDEAVGKLKSVFDHFDLTGDETYVVSDTNALLTNKHLEKWNFKGISHFCIFLIPTVLSELDRLKDNHRNEQVRRKAKGLIHQIKEYGRRGRLVDGVTVVKNRITLKTVAREPDMESTLSWLDKDNADDRILASVLQVMKEHVDAPVVLVTTDINMQNKAQAACIPYVEPPS
jgi:hypothetical protein